MSWKCSSVGNAYEPNAWNIVFLTKGDYDLLPEMSCFAYKLDKVSAFRLQVSEIEDGRKRKE